MSARPIPISERIPAGSTVVIDASVLIAHLGGAEASAALASVVIDDFVRAGRNEAVLSALTLAECLVRPMRMGSEQTELVFDWLVSLPGLTLRSMDLSVASEAARIRAASALALPDAVVIATGVLAGCQMLVTNDRRLALAAAATVPEMGVCLLAEHT